MVARSGDLSAFLVLLSASVALPAWIDAASRRVGELAVALWSAGTTTTADASRAALSGGIVAAELIGPVVATAFTMVVVVNVAQVGLRFVPRRLAPSLRNVSPAANLRRIVSPQPGLELAKSVVKLVAALALATVVVASSLQALAQAASSPLAAASAAAGAALRFLRAVAALGVALGIVDLVRQRRALRRRLRMTRQELRDELREHEGDATTKARRRRLAREFLRRAMLRDVANADVVVVNPSHVAVALRYDHARDRAPIVVARGRDYLAATIRERARSAGVPIVEDPLLARVIYVATRVGEPIPASLFLVVARLLAFVYRLPSLARSIETRHVTNPEDVPLDLAARAWSLLAEPSSAQGGAQASREAR